jgi:hypothetical protein
MKKNYDFSKAKRGAVIRTPRGKTRITIRIDETARPVSSPSDSRVQAEHSWFHTASAESAFESSARGR